MSQIDLPSWEVIEDPHKMVGHYIQIEQEHARIAHKNRVALIAGEPEGEDYRRAEDIVYEAKLLRWLEATESYLPDWFIPNYVGQIHVHLKDLFRDVTGRLNHEIEQYRFAFGDTEKNLHRSVQEAYEYCRKRLYHLVIPLSERRLIEPPKAKIEQPHPLECQCDKCTGRV